MPARTFRAFSMSRAVQSRTLTPPIFCNAGALTVLAETCLCRVRIVTPSFLAASRVERLCFIYTDPYHVSTGRARETRCILRCTIDRRKVAKGGEWRRMMETENKRDAR